MESRFTRITFVIFTFFFTLHLQAQTPWELEKEDDGIMAYTRSRPGIKFKEYKVHMEMEATLSQAMSLFKDFPVHHKLFPGTEGIKVMMDEGDHYVTYVKFDLPFPARDRDAIFNNVLTFDQRTKTLTTSVTCLDDEYETDPDLIQIKFCEGSWIFEDIGNGMLKVTNQLIVDPAGFAPAFIVNSKTVDDPIKTFKSLRVMIDNDKYRGHSFSLLGN